jgi:hypothetical protein
MAIVPQRLIVDERKSAQLITRGELYSLLHEYRMSILLLRSAVFQLSISDTGKATEQIDAMATHLDNLNDGMIKLVFKDQ